VGVFAIGVNKVARNRGRVSVYYLTRENVTRRMERTRRPIYRNNNGAIYSSLTDMEPFIRQSPRYNCNELIDDRLFAPVNVEFKKNTRTTAIVSAAVLIFKYVRNPRAPLKFQLRPANHKSKRDCVSPAAGNNGDVVVTFVMCNSKEPFSRRPCIVVGF